MHPSEHNIPTSVSSDVDPAELLRAVTAGLPGAWNELVSRYTPLLRSRISGFRLQEADAQDVAQITWMRLAENLHRIHTPAYLGGWLATVVTRECIRVKRHGSQALPADEEIAAAPDPGPGPDQTVVDRDVHRFLRRAMDALSPRRREMMEALFADDRLPYAEIAQDLGMAIGSLGPTRARTLTELRRMLDLAGVSA